MLKHFLIPVITCLLLIFEDCIDTVLFSCCLWTLFVFPNYSWFQMFHPLPNHHHLSPVSIILWSWMLFLIKHISLLTNTFIISTEFSYIRIYVHKAWQQQTHRLLASTVTGDSKWMFTTATVLRCLNAEMKQLLLCLWEAVGWEVHEDRRFVYSVASGLLSAENILKMSQSFPAGEPWWCKLRSLNLSFLC